MDLDFLVFCVCVCVGVSFIFCVCLFFSVAIEMFSMNKVDYKCYIRSSPRWNPRTFKSLRIKVRPNLAHLVGACFTHWLLIDLGADQRRLPSARGTKRRRTEARGLGPARCLGGPGFWWWREREQTLAIYSNYPQRDRGREMGEDRGEEQVGERELVWYWYVVSLTRSD